MYSPSQTISVKSGNTFSLFCSYLNDDGSSISLKGTTITADLKNKAKTLVTAMNIETLDNGNFIIRPPNGFIIPCGAYYTDIRFTVTGVVVNSDIIQINVKEVVTDG